MKKLFVFALIVIGLRASEEVKIQASQAKEHPIIEAARKNDFQAVKKLLSEGVDVNTANQKGWTPLFYAVRGVLVEGKGPQKLDLDLAEKLIANKANVNLKDTFGNTPLHYAAIFGQVEAVKLLLKNGADINAKNVDKRTPIMFVIRNLDEDSKTHGPVENRLEAIKTLLNDPKIDLTIKDLKGQTALDLAKARKNQDAYKLLLESSSSLIDLIQEGKSKEAIDEINAGANIKIKDTTTHYNIITVAIQKNDYEVLKAIFDKYGKNFDYESLIDEYKVPSFLYSAVIENGNGMSNLKIIKLLLEQGFDPNKTGKPILWVDFDLSGKTPTTPLELAKSHGLTEIVNLFEEHSKRKSPPGGLSLSSK